MHNPSFRIYLLPLYIRRKCMWRKEAGEILCSVFPSMVADEGKFDPLVEERMYPKRSHHHPRKRHIGWSLGNLAVVAGSLIKVAMATEKSLRFLQTTGSRNHRQGLDGGDGAAGKKSVRKEKLVDGVYCWLIVVFDFAVARSSKICGDGLSGFYSYVFLG